MLRRGLVTVLAVALSGCAGQGDQAVRPPAFRDTGAPAAQHGKAPRCDPAQRARATRALRAMRRDSRAQVKVERDRCGFVREFEGDLPLTGHRTVRQALDRYAHAFGLRTTFAELRAYSAERPLVDFEQIYRRVPLARSPRLTVLLGHGRIASVSSTVCPYVKRRIGAPRVSRSDAVRIARRSVPEDPPPSRPRLVVYPLHWSFPCGGGKSVLAWETQAGYRPIWIDATTGRVLTAGPPLIY